MIDYSKLPYITDCICGASGVGIQGEGQAISVECFNCHNNSEVFYGVETLNTSGEYEIDNFDAISSAIENWNSKSLGGVK